MNQCNGIIVLKKRPKKICYVMELTLKQSDVNLNYKLFLLLALGWRDRQKKKITPNIILTNAKL